MKHLDPVGPDNDRHIMEALDGADLIVAAWGASYPATAALRMYRVRRMLAGRAHHLGLTKSGQPKHPLYLPAAAVLLPFGEQP